MEDHKASLQAWCWDHTITPALYDREAVDVSGTKATSYTMFCLVEGVKDTGRGGSREEAEQEAARKVLAKLVAAARARKTSSLMNSLHTRRLSLEEPVSFLERVAEDQRIQVITWSPDLLTPVAITWSPDHMTN